MNNVITSLALCICALFSLDTMAQTWEGQGEAGLVKTSGNTESESLNLGIDLSYSHAGWSNSLVETSA